MKENFTLLKIERFSEDRWVKKKHIIEKIENEWWKKNIEEEWQRDQVARVWGRK